MTFWWFDENHPVRHPAHSRLVAADAARVARQCGGAQMNKQNLIRLGALAQQEFHMSVDFRIMEVASDFYSPVRVIVNGSDYDVVELKKVGMIDNYEYAWCGYSRRANTLIIKEADKVDVEVRRW
jgi:hypothetical protein